MDGSNALGLNGTTPNGTGAAPNGPPPLAVSRVTYAIVTTTLFSVIFVTGLIGNSISIAAVTRRRHMRTSCNYLIINIALADLGVALVATPLRILETFVSWPLGKELCSILWPLQDVCVCVSVVTHTVIALERHRVIVSPFKPRFSLRKTKLFALGIWLGCYVATGMPIAFTLTLAEQGGWVFCSVVWPSPLFRQGYIVYLVAVFICLPLIVQTVAYVRVMRCTRKKSMLDSRGCGSQRKSREDRKTRLLKTLITILVVFQICYLPRGVLMIWAEFGSLPDPSTAEALIYVELVTLALYYCKHVINPLILFGMSREFRDAYKSLIKCESDRAVARRRTLLTASVRSTRV